MLDQMHYYIHYNHVYITWSIWGWIYNWVSAEILVVVTGTKQALLLLRRELAILAVFAQLIALCAGLSTYLWDA